MTRRSPGSLPPIHRNEGISTMTTLHSLPSDDDEPEPSAPPPAAQESTDAQPAELAGRRTFRVPPARVDEPTRTFGIRRLRAIVLVMLVASIDVILIQTTWNRALGVEPWEAWVLAGVTALGASVLMWTAGHQFGEFRVYRLSANAWAAAAAVLVWCAVGFGLAWLRWHVPSKSAVQAMSEGGSVNPEPLTHGFDHTVAVVLIALYLCPGLLAFIDGLAFGHPIATLQRESHKRLLEVREELSRREGQAVLLSQLLARHCDEIALIDEQADYHRVSHAALARELKGHTRSEILRRIGDPSAGGITQGDGPGTGAGPR